MIQIATCFIYIYIYIYIYMCVCVCVCVCELKHTSRQWYIKFHNVIVLYNFIKNIIDQCIYLKVKGNKYIFLILYVDDILLTSNDLGLLHETNNFFLKTLI